MIDGSVVVDPGPEPPNLLPDSWSTLEPPPPDTLPAGASFGEVIDEPADEYVIPQGEGAVAARRRAEFVRASFFGANPRHDMRLGGTFLRVERAELGEWSMVADDDDEMTRFKWNLVETRTGVRDRAPSAGFRHKHGKRVVPTHSLLSSLEVLSASTELILRTTCALACLLI